MPAPPGSEFVTTPVALTPVALARSGVPVPGSHPGTGCMQICRSILGKAFDLVLQPADQPEISGDVFGFRRLQQGFMD